MGNPVDITRPHVGDQVHYVSFGTPGGEYSSRCRAAFVTEVGQWVTQAAQPHGNDERGREHRTLLQRFEADALALAVINPTGLFFNGAGPVACTHDPGLDTSGPVAKPVPLRGGTWHRAGEGGCTA